jgi:hypothetical protein
VRLENLQRWLQSVVVHHGTTEEALKSPAATRLLRPKDIGKVLLPSKTLTAPQRIAVYQEMYPMRMRDALSSDYPGIEHFLGDRFWDFVVAYTKVHPSMGYTLNRLGDHVPRFIAAQRKFGPSGFLTDLAKLELAITEAFDEAESPLLKADDLAAFPQNRLAKSRLVTTPSLRLVTLDWNADAYLDTLRDDDHRHPQPKRSKSWVAVVRRNYSVYRLPVSQAAFEVLTDIRSGRSIADVVERSLLRRGPKRAAPEDFANWFRSWTSEGFFSALAPAKRRNA